MGVVSVAFSSSFVDGVTWLRIPLYKLLQVTETGISFRLFEVVLLLNISLKLKFQLAAFALIINSGG